MKTNQDIKQKREEIRKEIDYYKNLKFEMFPRGFAMESQERRNLLGKMYQAIQTLETQEDALTYILNEDSILKDATLKVREDSSFLVRKSAGVYESVCGCNCYKTKRF